MLKIRLHRVGRKNDPSFRVVAIDSRRGPKAGKYVEVLGFHSARNHLTNLKPERILHWISKGAQTSGTVHNLLIAQGVLKGTKINVLPLKRPIASAIEKEAPKATEGVSKLTTEEKTEEKVAEQKLERASDVAAPSAVEEIVIETPASVEEVRTEAPVTEPIQNASTNTALLVEETKEKRREESA